ncbi:hypothetical protein GCM10027277_27120 [Pseudoduganella ginsengisoli]|uniref:hypothetical protein n=1 Tax=Pseudoduganella ginsengisoli TaxID=1462440 RepID=UPI0014792CED|nr:hypothetical protein [Pseudoduganella ginsengisoli]
MKRAIPKLAGALQNGVAAIELALCLSACALLAPTVLALAGVFLHYAAMQKAVHEGARYMASLPPQALGTDAAATQAMAAARAIMVETARQAGLEVTLQPEQIIIECDGFACYGTLPSSIKVSAAINVPLSTELFSTETSGTVQVRASHTMRYGYAGN